MHPLRPIFWHQGLFLQPQHFQHSDLFWQTKQAELSSLMSPYPWGIIRLELDKAALSTSQLRLIRLKAVMRDGSLIHYPGNAIVESRSFELSKISHGMNVYLGLRRWSPEQANVNVVNEIDPALEYTQRLVAEANPEIMADSYAQGPEGRVSLMSFAMRLFWADELDDLGDYELIPLLRLEQDGDQARWAKKYIPPCLNIDSSPILMQLLRQIRDEIAGRAHQLEIFKPSSLAKTEDMDVNNVSLLMALGILNRYAAALTHTLELPQSHPWSCYGLLRQLVGELSTFSNRYDMLGTTRDGQKLIPPYQHDEIYVGFDAINVVIRHLLDEIAAAPEMLVRFEPQDISAGLYKADLPDGFFGKRHRYHLLVYGAETEQLTEWMRDAKLATPEEIERLVVHALSGVELLQLTEAPRGIPRRSSALYFYIDPLSNSWASIEESQQAILFIPQAVESLQIELIVSKW